MSFAKGWTKRRDAARARAEGHNKRGSTYRLYSDEMHRRDVISRIFSEAQSALQRLLSEKETLSAQLRNAQHRAEEAQRHVDPSHPVVLRLAAIEPLIAAAAKALKAAEVVYRRDMRESDARMAALSSKVEVDAEKEAKAEAAAQAAYDAAMEETQ